VGHPPVRVLFIWDSNKVEGLEMVMPLPAPSNLVLKPLYTALFLAFAQDLEDWVIYGPFGII
jgi:hypothetical protein